jgi:hypothetical protein
MDQTKNERMEGKMRMWKMRKEMLDSMSEKELRAFITGYMMAEKMILKQLGSQCGCGCGCGQQGCDCKDDSCKCDDK